MRKLKLDVEVLNVESFESLPPVAQVGTVRGQVADGEPETLVEDDSTGCDGGGWGSFFGTCAGCPTVGTCVGPTYCCPPTWRPTCANTCYETCKQYSCVDPYHCIP